MSFQDEYTLAKWSGLPREIFLRESRLNEFCQQHDCRRPIVERIALTPAQVGRYRLPTRPTKREKNTHANNFQGNSVELDALPSSELRALVRDCMERHISDGELEILREAEKSEQKILEGFASDWRQP
jgi:hypothetical protein